jgi:putative transposase
MLGDVEVDDTPPIVGEHDEDEEDAPPRGGHGDEVDRDQVSDVVDGHAFRQRVAGMRILEVLTAAHSPWQNPFVERLIGSVRRECLDHALVLSERHLRRLLAGYFSYYHRARTHLSLEKDAPDVPPIERPELGSIVQIPEVGGLHHRYVRRVA